MSESTIKTTGVTMAAGDGRDSGSDGGAGRGSGRRWVASVTIVGAGLLVAAGCGTADDDDGHTIVATTTVLGDVAARVARCGGLEVATLIPVGADPHDYSPSSAEVRDLVRADLVIANGLCLEEGLASALESAREDGANVLEVASLLDPRAMDRDDAPSNVEEDADHADGGLDPHVWLDVSRMADAAALIGGELAEVTGDDAFRDCGERVAAELMATDAEVREILDVVPDGSRVLVTDHDAFGYFAEAYDFDVAGVVIPGGSTLAEPSSAELAALADVVRDAGVRAIFANTAHRTALIEALSAEVGDVAVVELYVGSVGGEGSGAEDYAAMMLTDARLIAQTLSD